MTERSSSESSTSSISITFDTSATTTTTAFKTKTLSSSLSTIKKSLSQRRKSDSAASKSKIPKKKRRPISLVTNKTAVEIDSSMENSYNNKRSTKFFSKKKSSVIVEEPPQPPVITPSLNITTDSLSSSSETSPQSSSEPSSQTSSEPTSPTISQHPKSSSTITNPSSVSETSETSNNNNSNSSQQTKSSSTTSNSASETSEPPETSTNSHMEITTFLAAPRLTQRVRLSSGRVVSFSEVGDRNGFPVFVFLGMGCVRYFIAFFDDLATSYNLRLICPDRPGIGLSDDVKAEDQQVLKWPDVIDELCNIMEIPKFFIMAHSAGAPYALACAMKIPQRLQGTIYLVSPWVSTTVANNFKWLQYVPTPIIRLTNSAGISLQQMKHGRQPYSIKPQSQRNSGALAAQMSSNEKKQQLGLAILKASFAENLAGANNDLLMCFERKRTFGFSYTDVKHPVHVFHGTKDDRIPISAVKWMEENMSSCKLTLIEGGKHSLFLKAEVVDSIFKSIAVQLHDRENCRLCKLFSKCWLMEEAENSRKEREIEIQRRVVESFKKSVKRKQSINDTSNEDSDKERKLEIQRKVVDSFKENVKRNQTINMMKTGTSNIVLDHQRSSTDKISQNGPVYTYI